MYSSIQEIRNWHTQSLENVQVNLKTSNAGLGKTEAAQRLKYFGENRLPQKTPPTLWLCLVRQFRSPLIYLLLAAATVSLAIGDAADASFIGIVLVLNACIGGYQEWRAERQTHALRRLLKFKTTVIRDGEIQEIAAEDVVPGDVVLLESGCRIAADMRLFEAQGLEIDESLLTGESLPVCKDVQGILPEGTMHADRKNMAFGGTLVSRGRGKGYVTATGTNTMVGELALEMVTAEGNKLPLLARMERFNQTIALVVLIACSVVAVAGILFQGRGLPEMFLFAVALAVSAIPEGLPVALTATLAVATRRMARRNVIVRQLAAAEGLGSCNMIASDKTGTLTRNELTIKKIFLANGSFIEVEGSGFEPIGKLLPDNDNPLLHSFFEACVLCNEGELNHRDGKWVWRGDPTDVAFLTLACKKNITKVLTLKNYPLIAQQPFESERQFAVSTHQSGSDEEVFVKGAPEKVLPMCGDVSREFYEKALSMAKQGYRVLAVGRGKGKLTFLGLAAMIDPLRAEAAESIQKAREAGIRVIMVTGDHPSTALAIAKELKLAQEPDEVMTGSQIERCTPLELDDAIRAVRVFARVTPLQKLNIVEAARRAGYFVAVTGDGVNDAPALRSANIGVAMGRSGTDVAREAASIVLADDNFASIISGVEEGRVAYDNIRKIIFMLASTGCAEIILVGLCIVTGLPLPLLPVQLLWLNLVTNGIQDVALAFEHGEGRELKRAPRKPGESFFDRLMIERTLISASYMSVAAFLMFQGFLEQGWDEAAARNGVLLLMVLFENIHLGSCRSEIHSAFRHSPFSSPILLIGVIAALFIHVTAMYLPWFQNVLGTAPVDGFVWLTLFAIALGAFGMLEIHKLFWKCRKSGRG